MWSGSTPKTPPFKSTTPARVALRSLSVKKLPRYQPPLVLLPILSNTPSTHLSTSAHLLHQPLFPSLHPRSGLPRKQPCGWTRQTTSALMLLPRLDIMNLTLAKLTTVNSLRICKETMGLNYSTMVSISAQPAKSRFLLSGSSTSSNLASVPQSSSHTNRLSYSQVS